MNGLHDFVLDNKLFIILSNYHLLILFYRKQLLTI